MDAQGHGAGRVMGGATEKAKPLWQLGAGPGEDTRLRHSRLQSLAAKLLSTRHQIWGQGTGAKSAWPWSGGCLLCAPRVRGQLRLRRDRNGADAERYVGDTRRSQ